jgi:hypothetical protein
VLLVEEKRAAGVCRATAARKLALAASFPEIDTRLWPNFRDLAATRV